jgi:DNA adenine methylase
VFGYDKDPLVAGFWQEALKDPDGLADAALEHYPVSREKHFALRKRLPSMPEGKERAAVFYVINKTSFAGILDSGFSYHRNIPIKKSIDNLRALKTENLHIAKADFRESIERHRNDFLYLDPPYIQVARKLYREYSTIDHVALRDLLKGRDGWLMSYNDCNTVRDLYKDFRIEQPSWRYSMSPKGNRKSNELLIFSHDLDIIEAAA